jgi:hypothetical protein
MGGLLRRLTTPLGVLWILSHTVMVLLGALFLSSQALQAALGQGVSEGIRGALIATGIAGVSLFLYILTSETLRSRIDTFAKAGILTVFPSGRL